MNFEVTVIGEVEHPTVITVPNEKITMIKALGLAGDITIYGKKDNVLLISENDGRRKIKRINLNSKNFLVSSYYYLQPNDIVYVEANKEKVATASRNAADVAYNFKWFIAYRSDRNAVSKIKYTGIYNL